MPKNNLTKRKNSAKVLTSIWYHGTMVSKGGIDMRTPKNGDIIDHTIRKNERVKDKLIRCPECGKIGLKRTYLGKHKGEFNFQHKLQLKSMGWLVLESCYISKRRAEELRQEGKII